jgi:predicted phosphodiesterase
MKTLIIGDIHGNLPALEQVLAKEKNNFDQILCLGDVVNYGPWSDECVQLLAATENTTVLRGNHEEDFLRGSYSGSHHIAKMFFEFCYPKFTEFALINKYGFELKTGSFTICHTFNDLYLYPDSDLSSLGIPSNIIIGHSHYQFDRAVGTVRVINTGSVGQNRKHINLSEYLLYDHESGVIELKNNRFDVNTVLSKMAELYYPAECLGYYQEKSRI